MIQGTSDSSASNWASDLYRRGAADMGAGMQARLAALDELAMDDARFRNSLANMRQRHEAKKAAKASSGMDWGSVGAIAGMVLAPFTGGLSLTTLAVGAGLGGAVGSAAQNIAGKGRGGGGGNIGSQLMDVGKFANEYMMDNDLFEGQATNKTVDETVEAVAKGAREAVSAPEAYKYNKGVSGANANPKWMQYERQADMYNQGGSDQ